jgi:hypothetical protein
MMNRRVCKALLIAVMTLATGCATTNDALYRAERIEKERPGFAETRTIAEEGFIYGPPVVMNCKRLLVGEHV